MFSRTWITVLAGSVALWGMSRLGEGVSATRCRRRERRSRIGARFRGDRACGSGGMSGGGRFA